MNNISFLIQQLSSRNHTEAYQTLQILQKKSHDSDCLYPYFEDFIDMINQSRSYVRIRGLLLIIANAKWDMNMLIDQNIDTILTHITDNKPTVARQFIQALPELIKYKPQLIPQIKKALIQADIHHYQPNMQSLVLQDIQKLLSDIKTINS